MAHGDTDHLLDLVSTALAEFDDRPLSVTARRVARIASMLGETELAVRLGLELKPSGGHPPTNGQETRRLMADPTLWGTLDGPAERALDVYMENRRVEHGDQKGKLVSHGLDEIQDWIGILEDETFVDNTVAFDVYMDVFASTVHMNAILGRVRHSCFTALCAWERRLAYSNVNEQIFERFRADVDASLAAGAPELLEQFSAVYRRLREASANPDAPASREALAQAVTTCRRILKSVADHLLPGVHGTETEDGHRLNDAAYKNRIFEFLKNKVNSDTTEAAIRSAVGGVFARFEALDALASKGVHASVGLAEAEMCAIGTYLAAGELLRVSTGEAGYL